MRVEFKTVNVYNNDRISIFFALAMQTHFVIWCYLKLFYFSSLLIQNAHNIRHLMMRGGSHSQNSGIAAQQKFSTSVFIQLWRIPLQKKNTKYIVWKEILFKSCRRFEKSRKSESDFFSLNKIEAWSFSVLLTLISVNTLALHICLIYFLYISRVTLCLSHTLECRLKKKQRQRSYV